MPLWDNFARQAEALPVASPHGADDFVAIHDASAGAVHQAMGRGQAAKGEQTHVQSVAAQ